MSKKIQFFQSGRKGKKIKRENGKFVCMIYKITLSDKKPDAQKCMGIGQNYRRQTPGILKAAAYRAAFQKHLGKGKQAAPQGEQPQSNSNDQHD